MQPTLKQIAELAGVSIGTVHRVIHKNGPVSPKNRERIEQIIKYLNYKPNIMARSLVKGMKLNFAVILPEQYHDGGYWKLPAEGIRLAGYELQHLQINVDFFCFDKFSPDSFLEAGRKALADKPEGLLLAPVQETAARQFLSGIPDHVPYIFIDSDIPDIPCLSVIHQASLNSGYVAAQLMQMAVQAPATLGIIRFLPNTFHIDQRAKGFHDYFSGPSGLKIVCQDIPEQSSAEAIRRHMDALFRNNPNMQGLFVTDAHTYEVADYLAAQQKNLEIMLIGFDLIPKNIDQLKRGTIDFLISQHPDLQGYLGIQSLYRHVMLKEYVEKEILLPVEIITKENVHFSKSYHLNRTFDLSQ